MGMNLKSLLAPAAIVGGIVLFIRWKEGVKIEASTFSQIEAQPGTVKIPDPLLIPQVVKQAQQQAPVGTPGIIAINQVLTSDQILAAVNAAIEASGDDPTPSISIPDSPYGVAVTVQTESIAVAAAQSGMSIQDWGSQYGFW